MTSLVERYLAAAMRGIPDRQKADVERELRSSIADAVEDRVSGGEDRVAAETAVLEGFGDPTRLAAGITGRPLYLIGPDLFLVYRRLLVTLLSLVVPVVAVVAAAAELGGGRGYADAIIGGIGGGLTVGLHIAFWVTLGFAIIERVDAATWDRAELKEVTGPWTVERLPELPSRTGVSLGDTVTEILTTLLSIGALLFLRGFTLPAEASGDPVPLLHSGFVGFWLPALIVGFAALVGLEVVKYVVGRWTMPLALGNAALQLAIAVPAVALAIGGSLINPEFAARIGWPPLAQGTGPVMLSIAAASLLVACWEIFDGFRHARRSSSESEATGGLTA
jgi:hypothetical protein